ncbi:hypothetical protein BTI679_31980 [Bacillus wiedmannii]|nr:hypothetical protein BTI679_31980 [Bacillus wiedmannii]
MQFKYVDEGKRNVCISTQFASLEKEMKMM